MELTLSIIALVMASVALGVSALTYWRDWRKPLKLDCTIRGIIWSPPLGGRTDTPFSLILALVMRNQGAQQGFIQAAYIQLLSLETPQREFRLEALATVDTNLVIQMARSEDEAEKAKALLGIGGFIQFGKYEMKELGIHFAWPPSDAARYEMFAKPFTLEPGDYDLELWCCVNNGWDCYARYPGASLQQAILDTVSGGELVINMFGGIYDTAPGAPLAG